MAGPIGEGQELLPGAGEPVAELGRQIARCRRRDDVVDGSLKRASLGGNRGWCQTGDVPGQAERLVQPWLEAHRQEVLAVLERIGDIACEMGEAGLVRIGVRATDGPSYQTWSVVTHGLRCDFTGYDSVVPGALWVYPQWTSLIGFVLRQKFTHKNLVKLLGWSGLSLDQEGPYGTRSNGTAVGIVRGIRGF